MKPKSRARRLSLSKKLDKAAVTTWLVFPASAASKIGPLPLMTLTKRNRVVL
jgi:hypothetical protein